MKMNVRYQGTVADRPIDTMVSQENAGRESANQRHDRTGDFTPPLRQPSPPAPNLPGWMIPPQLRLGAAGAGTGMPMNMSNLGKMQNYLDLPDNHGPDVWIRDVPTYIAG
jgi:hypothetical protein